MSFDFGDAFMSGVAEAGGTFVAISPGRARIGTDKRTLAINWEVSRGRFHAHAGRDTPLLEFACVTDGWDAWQAIDAGRDFAKRAYEIAASVSK